MFKLFQKLPSTYLHYKIFYCIRKALTKRCPLVLFSFNATSIFFWTMLHILLDTRIPPGQSELLERLCSIICDSVSFRSENQSTGSDRLSSNFKINPQVTLLLNQRSEVVHYTHLLDVIRKPQYVQLYCFGSSNASSSRHPDANYSTKQALFSKSENLFLCTLQNAVTLRIRDSAELLSHRKNSKRCRTDKRSSFLQSHNSTYVVHIVLFSICDISSLLVEFQSQQEWHCSEQESERPAVHLSWIHVPGFNQDPLSRSQRKLSHNLVPSQNDSKQVIVSRHFCCPSRVSETVSRLLFSGPFSPNHSQTVEIVFDQKLHRAQDSGRERTLIGVVVDAVPCQRVNSTEHNIIPWPTLWVVTAVLLQCSINIAWLRGEASYLIPCAESTLASRVKSSENSMSEKQLAGKQARFFCSNYVTFRCIVELLARQGSALLLEGQLSHTPQGPAVRSHRWAVALPPADLSPTSSLPSLLLYGVTSKEGIFCPGTSSLPFNVPSAETLLTTCNVSDLEKQVTTHMEEYVPIPLDVMDLSNSRDTKSEASSHLPKRLHKS